MARKKAQVKAEDYSFWGNKALKAFLGCDFEEDYLERTSAPKWSREAYAVLCHGVERWRKEGRQDPMVFTYASANEAEEARWILEDFYSITEIACLGSTLFVDRDAPILEALFERDRVHQLFTSKLRAAVDGWHKNGSQGGITLTFATHPEVSYAKEELYGHFGIQDDAEVKATTLEIPPHYADLIVRRLEGTRKVA